MSVYPVTPGALGGLSVIAYRAPCSPMSSQTYRKPAEHIDPSIMSVYRRCSVEQRKSPRHVESPRIITGPRIENLSVRRT